jgi:hypothetical protein
LRPALPQRRLFARQLAAGALLPLPGPEAKEKSSAGTFRPNCVRTSADLRQDFRPDALDSPVHPLPAAEHTTVPPPARHLHRVAATATAMACGSAPQPLVAPTGESAAATDTGTSEAQASAPDRALNRVTLDATSASVLLEEALSKGVPQP